MKAAAEYRVPLSEAVLAVLELALAPAVGSSVERSYARSDLFHRRRTLTDQWLQYVLGGGAKVVSLPR